MEKQHQFAVIVQPNAQIEEVVSWLANRSAAEVREHREKVIARIKRTAATLRMSGECERWLGRADFKI